MNNDTPAEGLELQRLGSWSAADPRWTAKECSTRSGRAFHLSAKVGITSGYTNGGWWVMREDRLIGEWTTPEEADMAAEELYERIRRIQASPPPPRLGSGSLSSCGCSDWTDGLGNSGRYYCSAHRPADHQSLEQS